MQLKKHIPAEGHKGFTLPYSLFAPLSTEELEAISHGADAFFARYPDCSLFPDPFFEPIRISQSYSLSTLQIVVGDDPHSAEVAATLVSTLKENWNFEVPILKTDDVRVSLDHKAPLLLIGGANINRLSMQIAKQYQIGLFCADFPGTGGWGIVTHWELESGMPPRYILVASDKVTMTRAIGAFIDHAIKGSITPSLKWIHRVSPGCSAPFGLSEDFDAWISRRAFAIPEVVRWIESGCGKPYRQVFQEFYQKDFSKSLPYNAELLDVGINAIRYYQMTGDPKALNLFRETMWGFWNYLIDEDPKVYISDFDFRLGTLCNYWNWIEHNPSISSTEQRFFTKLLLGAMRMVSDYFRFRWKSRPGPHNHQTFKARTLIQGWRYFGRWDLPDLIKWRDDADGVFNRINPKAFKHRENANHYERFVPEHTLVWLEVTGRECSLEMRASLVKFATREWSLRDPFLSPLDYGDSEATFTPSRPFRVAPWLSGETAEEVELLEMEANSEGMFPFEFPAPIASFTGIGLSNKGRELKGPVGWGVMPLDSLLTERFPLSGDAASRFDKLIWREGWTPDAAYLAIEGFGNETVSHAHNEVNGVLRMNLAGRIWLVSNGYGKRAGISDAAMAFRTRQRGPEEHNMLVIRTADGACLKPPVNANLIDHRSDPLPFAVTEIADYGGFHWRRHTFHISKVGFFFVDQVKSLNDRVASSSVEIEWNLMGRKLDRAGGCRFSLFEQHGVTLVFDCPGLGELRFEESQIDAWRKLIDQGEYPFSQSMPTHCILKAGGNALASGVAHYFVSGFWLEGAVQTHLWDGEKNRLLICLTESIQKSPAISERPWGSIDLQGKCVAIDLEDPMVPHGRGLEAKI